MNRRLVPLLLLLAAGVFAAAALADVAIIATRPLLPWFSWMLP